MEFEDLLRFLGARFRLWSEMATRGVQEVAAACDFHMQEWGAQAATLEQYQAYLKVKGLFSDSLAVAKNPVIIAPDARYTVDASWPGPAQKDEGIAPARLRLVLEYMHSLMTTGLERMTERDGWRVSDVVTQFYYSPAFIGRTLRQDLQDKNLTGEDQTKAVRDYKKKYRKSKEKIEKVTRRQWTKQGKKPAKEQSRLDEINKYTVGDSKRHIKKFSTDVEKLKVPFTTFLQKATPDGSREKVYFRLSF
ncbi:hypothetical protein CYMTET_24399 [Cymbomonas tetramitiformis]|uniref:Uncharacterized protein n=1 Tax=Cymbomonas tetramitiformis TaxID=36881 RepID=A0AAE0KZY6_9CHLO|nr:hypothetical protein CYMTET_24399 [Cymbomonas tetramitiformis]